MSNEELKSHIDLVHQQLEDSQVHAEDKDLVGLLMTKIVSHGAKGASTDDGASASLNDALAAQAAKFENSHPAIAGAIRQVMNSLSSMGI